MFDFEMLWSHISF